VRGLRLIDPAFLAAASPPAFSPSDIAGLHVWFDINKGLFTDGAETTPVTADGDRVGAWKSQTLGGGSTFDLVQYSNSIRPTYKTGIINGKPAILFNGSDQFLGSTAAFSKAQPNTTFIVLKMITTGAYHGITDGDATARWAYEEYPGGRWGIWVTSGADIDLAAVDTNWNIWTVLWKGASTKYGFNTGTLSASGNIGSGFMGGMKLGVEGSAYANMYVSEFLWYNAELAAGDLSKVVNYLGTKYGITVS
jgi:hypothetical protein